MIQIIGSGFTLVHVLFDTIAGTGLGTCFEAIISQIVLMGKVLSAPVSLDYPHHLCYNRLVIYSSASLQINP